VILGFFILETQVIIFFVRREAASRRQEEKGIGVEAIF
jgi:hypothetical protein